MTRIGFDAGTYNLVACTRNEKNDFLYKREVNAFLEMPLENKFVFNMMKKAGVPLILREDANLAYALGEAAIEMAYTMPQIELRRPMKDGCVNPKEKDAFQIMNIMIHSLIGNVDFDKSIVYYTVPANAINTETDADYHGKLLDAIFKAYKSETGNTVQAFPINEALALIYAELADKNFTGVGISCGAGQINICFAIFGAPVFAFSIVNSGDWIDKQAAKATNESIAFINKEKHKIDLTKEPTSLIERAIQTQYRLMIEKTVSGIKKGVEDTAKKAKTGAPIDFVIAGGTSSPPGFDTLFKEVLFQSQLPIDIGRVIRPDDPLFAVARGALVAAENHEK
jgi:actin-like ATPase involved in cell morphogenesis